MLSMSMNFPFVTAFGTPNQKAGSSVATARNEGADAHGDTSGVLLSGLYREPLPAKRRRGIRAGGADVLRSLPSRYRAIRRAAASGIYAAICG
jgi:hypothetical protein